jgi:hypothetical protein
MQGDTAKPNSSGTKKSDWAQIKIKKRLKYELYWLKKVEPYSYTFFYTKYY